MIPSSLNAAEINHILREGYDTERLIEGYRQIIEELNLDYLLIDTHPGISEEMLLSISISDILFVIMRPDRQDYQGTAIAVELAKKLDVPSIYLIINKVTSSMEPELIQQEAEKAYEVPVAEVFPLSEEMLLLGSSGLFTRLHPNDLVTQKFHHLVKICLDNKKES